MNKEEEEDFQRLVEEADECGDCHFVCFAEGVVVGVLLMIAWAVW